MAKKDDIQAIIDLQRRVDRDRRQLEMADWLRLKLSIGQLKSLFFISNAGSTNLGTLAAALKVTPTNTTGIVERLVKRGLITRTEDPQDRRFLLLRTTKRGEQLVSELRQHRRARMTEILNRLSDAEIVRLKNSMQTMVNAINAMDKEANTPGK
ncbi:MAG TPA: MarR family transcriptional regulator [Dehalococcoidales bacterium]|nr:MarR family transcriptional regulator [Dehalococcoidales bacterium]